jgi:hypothetical protein
MHTKQVSKENILRNVILFLGLFLILLKSDLSYKSVFLYYTVIVIFAVSLKNDSINKYGLLFASAMLIRIGFCVFIDIFPPEIRYSSNWWVNMYPLPVIFDDETFFLAWAKHIMKAVDYIDLSERYDRMAYIFRFMLKYFGEQIIWGRLLNSFFCSVIVVLMYNTLVLSLGEKFRKYYWWLCLLTPVLIIWSITYIKEAFLVMGVALVLNSLVIFYKRIGNIRAYFQLVIGVIICFWIRSENLIPLAFLLPSVTIGENKESRFIRPLTWLMLWSIAGISLFLIFSPLFGLETIRNITGLNLNIYLDSFKQVKEGYNIVIPFYSWVMRQHGVLLGLGYCLLLLESPVITSVWTTLPIIGNPSWNAFGTSTYAISWWICIPFLIAGVWRSFKEKNLFWLSASSGFILWFLMTAFARMGAGMDSVRYRDSMLPLIVLLAGKGFYHLAESWNDKLWNRTFIKVYFWGVLALILARGVGLISMK